MFRGQSACVSVETSLTMTNVAIASGFGSARRFNAAIRKTYRRTPTQLRRLTRLETIQPENHYLFHLRFRPPYHWRGMLGFLAARATPGVEAVDMARGSYRRSISRNGHQGWFEVSLEKASDSIALRLQFADPHGLYPIVERIRGMFDLNADFEAIAQGLGADAELAKRIRAEPGLRVPGCWDGFELATRAILGQQITVKGATTLAGRLARSFGEPFPAADGLTHLFPRPEVLAGANLAGVGLTTKRAETVRALARAVRDGDVRFERTADSERVVAKLREIAGIGDWTARYVAMRALGDPDALPSGDLGLLRALGLKSARDLEKRAEAWRPWRSYASMYLWET